MPGIYGEMLSAFPELLLRHTVFTMQPKVEGGFAERVVYKTVRAYLTRDTGGEGSYKGDDTFVEGQQARFYLMDRLPEGLIRQGMYVEDNGELFKFVQDNNWAREGGFAVHKLIIVTGPTDQQYTNVQVEENIIDAY